MRRLFCIQLRQTFRGQPELPFPYMSARVYFAKPENDIRALLVRLNFIKVMQVSVCKLCLSG